MRRFAGRPLHRLPNLLRGVTGRHLEFFGDSVSSSRLPLAFRFHLIIRLPMGLLPIVHAHGSTVRRVSPINVSVDISCGPDMPVGDISSLDWRYLAFKGLIRVPWDIYLRFRGLAAKYERLQNGMVPMAIDAQYSRYHVSAPPRNVDRCFAAVESTPRNADSVGS